MRLDRVVLTGADDSILPTELIPMSVNYPHVEWGILVSARHAAIPRFPSLRWIAALQDIAETRRVSGMPMNLSLHVCGHWVRRFLLGEFEIPQDLMREFRRVQLNFHGEAVPFDHDLMVDALAAFGDRQVIFQFDGRDGQRHFEAVLSRDEDRAFNVVPLHDRSRGTGIAPAEWPDRVVDERRLQVHDDVLYQGYAGGLGPDNIIVELDKIATKARGNQRIWIDMEARVRSQDDRKFDLAKCRKVLELVDMFVEKPKATPGPAAVNPAAAWPFPDHKPATDSRIGEE